MASLICGSMAYDTIMKFPDRFSNHLLADHLQEINVAFLVPEMRREFGGTAGNIAYSLKLLGDDPLIMATIGIDGSTYRERLTQLKISQKYIKTINENYTAQAFITTDQKNNQITAFHPGAMSFAHKNSVLNVTEQIDLAIVAPDGKGGMIQNAQQCAEKKIPFIFDPGQGLPMFNQEELCAFIKAATYVAVNQYEFAMLTQNANLTQKEITDQVKALIVTEGERGATIYTASETIHIPAVKPAKILDPTGCGDAFRAGLIYGLTRNMDLPTAGRLASLMGSIKIAHQGPQNHVLTKKEIGDMFEKEFGYRYEK